MATSMGPRTGARAGMRRIQKQVGMVRAIAAMNSHLSSSLAFTPESLRPGAPSEVPELIWGPGKTPEQIANCMTALAERQRVVMAARIDPEVYAAVRQRVQGVEYNARSHTLKLSSPYADELPKPKRLPGSIAVVSADSADQFVAAECQQLSNYLGGYCFNITDVGANNLPKLLAQQEALKSADVVVVVCGTDCALPSIIAGITQSPVIAVPTSAGSGAALGGLAPLLAVLSSNTNVMTVNIDGGFQAAQAAVRMLRMASRLHEVRKQAEASLVSSGAAMPSPGQG